MASPYTLRAAYWIVFVGTFLGVSVWESLRPKRILSCPEQRRWTCHFILMFSQSILLYAVLRMSGPMLTAIAFADSKYGLLNRLPTAFAIRCVLAVLILDFVKFGTHRACHSAAILWRLHQVHHSDPDYDLTTGGRFHPVEAVLSVAAQMAAIALLAAPVAGVFIWQLLTTFQSLFAHANAQLPRGVEKAMRTIFFTPDLHRIHHSEEICEQQKNFGDLFPVWDRLFGTYLSHPEDGRPEIITGIKEFPKDRGSDLAYLLTLPLRSPAAVPSVAKDKMIPAP